MNIESIEYALITAGVGMGIVFFALLILSGVMLVIRAIFGGSPQANGTTPTATPAATAPIDPNHTGPEGLPRWAIAGAVAYIHAEEAFATPYASPWTQRTDEERR